MLPLSLKTISPRRPHSLSALPISAPSLFSLFPTKRTKLTTLFSYSSALFEKEYLPKPFPIKRFRTLLQNRGVSRSRINLGSRLFPLLTTRHSPLATAAVNPASPNVDAASSLSPLFATLTKNTGGGGTPTVTLSNSIPYSLSGSASSRRDRCIPANGPRAKSLVHCLSHGGSHLEHIRRFQPAGRAHIEVPKVSVSLTNHKTKASKT